MSGETAPDPGPSDCSRTLGEAVAAQVRTAKPVSGKAAARSRRSACSPHGSSGTPDRCLVHGPNPSRPTTSWSAVASCSLLSCLHRLDDGGLDLGEFAGG